MHRNLNPIIAVCGLHGAGKTTLCTDLLSVMPKDQWSSVKNTYYENIKLVEYRHPEYQKHEVGPNTIDYSNAYIWAKSLDYTHYSRTEILPTISSGQSIISDRWNYCYWALAMCQPQTLVPIKRMLSLLPKPDLVIYLDVDAETAIQRITSRGICTPEETIPQLNRLRGYYNQIFKSIPEVNVLKIQSTNAKKTFHQAIDYIHSIFKPYELYERQREGVQR